MKNLVAIGAGVLFVANVFGAEALVPETFVTQSGVYECTNVVGKFQLNIRTNDLTFMAFNSSSQSSGATYWNPGTNWFVYVGKDMRIWAFDGMRLTLMTTTPQGSESSSIQHIKETPPAAVLQRLPEKVKERLPVKP